MRGGETGEGHDGVDKVERPLGDRVGVDAVGRLNVEDGKVAGAKAANVAHKVVGLGAGVVAGVAKVVGAADGDAAGLDALPVLVEVRVKVARALGRLAELATKQKKKKTRGVSGGGGGGGGGGVDARQSWRLRRVGSESGKPPTKGPTKRGGGRTRAGDGAPVDVGLPQQYH